MSTKKIDQLGNLITLVPADDIEYLLDSEHFELTTQERLRRYYTHNDLNVEQTPEDTPSGPLYTEELTALVSMEPDDVLLFSTVPIVVFLRTLRGRDIAWGTLDYPVKCTPRTGVDFVELHLTHKSPVMLNWHG